MNFYLNKTMYKDTASPTKAVVTSIQSILVFV